MTLEDWFEKWWFSLPKHHFTSNNKGSKAECWIEVKKLAPDQELRGKIEWYTRELTLRTTRLKQAGMKVAGWKHAVRLVKYSFWINDLPSVSDAKEKAEATKCSCGADVAIAHKCSRCYQATSQDHKDRMQSLYDELKRIGLGKGENESKADWIARCKDFALENMGGAINKGTG